MADHPRPNAPAPAPQRPTIAPAPSPPLPRPSNVPRIYEERGIGGGRRTER